VKLNQNEPGTWLGIGMVMIVVGVIAGAAAEDSGVGQFLIGIGVLLLVVGVAIFVVRAGVSGKSK
jgi:ABC-type uncharacterized transport system permease subunit